MEAGFDIYVKQGDGASDYEDLLTDGNFQKYSGDKSVTIEKASDLIAMLFPTLPISLQKMAKYWGVFTHHALLWQLVQNQSSNNFHLVV